jgi:hypothetical protein
MKNYSKNLLTCIICLVGLLHTAGLCAQPNQLTSRRSGDQRNDQHDFDFEIGKWKTVLKRLQHPLTGSTSWVAYTGTTVVSKVWDGKANLVELQADGPARHLEALNLRLYNPQSRQWSLNFQGAAAAPWVNQLSANSEMGAANFTIRRRIMAGLF